MAAFDSSKDAVGKAAIIAPDKIGTKLEYIDIEHFSKREDAIIYEVHVRDFTSDPDIATKAQFGTYKAFIEKLPHIKNLGATHVQLLPIMNYYFGNELENSMRELEYSSQGNNYNWGYDPHNYFTPEGMYSENLSDPQLRIAELKELIYEIHELGMGVILDNVYNHTARISILEDIVPNYYHFMDKDGNPKSSYGGGRLGTTHAMSRKLMIDSIEYWVKEYKVDGFRFDLMGDLDAESVQMAFDNAVKHNPNMIFIGEGWRTYAGDDGDKRVPADQDWMNQTDSAACFSDEMRNELKSGFGSEGQPRFITGGKRSIRTIFDNICGRPGNMNEDDPGDVVQYIAAHDNLPLRDVIAQSIRKDPLIPENEFEIHKRIRLGNALVLTSQGIAFLHAGQEYGRTKHWLADGIPEDKYTTVQGFKYPHFIHDSYDSSDIINHIDWDKIEQPGLHQNTVNYTKGLIELRKSTDAFRLGSADLVKTNMNLIKCFQIGKEDLAIAYSCQSTNGEKYFIFMNCDTKKRIFATELNLKNGIVVVDSDEAGISEVTELSGAEFTASNTIALDPLTVIIIKD
jgi:secreted pullulanase